MSIANEIESIIIPALREHRIGSGRGSESGIVPKLTAAMNATGFSAAKYRIAGPIVLGRAPENGALRAPLSYAIADIGVHRDGELVAVIESEHDLAWVVPHGGKTPGSSASPRYTMSSLSSSSEGEPFASYAPLERMAYIANWKGDPKTTEEFLAGIRSDEPAIHNPRGLAFFLISEVRDSRATIIKPRMESLGARFYTAE